MKVLVFLVGSAFVLLLIVGAYSFYRGVRRIFGRKSDDYFDKNTEY